MNTCCIPGSNLAPVLERIFNPKSKHFTTFGVKPATLADITINGVPLTFCPFCGTRVHAMLDTTGAVGVK